MSHVCAMRTGTLEPLCKHRCRCNVPHRKTFAGFQEAGNRPEGVLGEGHLGPGFFLRVPPLERGRVNGKRFAPSKLTGPSFPLACRLGFFSRIEFSLVTEIHDDKLSHLPSKMKSRS